MKKEIIKLKIDKNKIINVILNKAIESKKTAEIIKKGAQRSFNYFSLVKIINFNIELIYSREEFDKIIEHKTENWVSAHSFTGKFIIFSPAEIEKHTSHKKSEFLQIISHETSHILLRKINTNFCTWLNEGIAQYISNQRQKEKIDPKNINYFIKECLFKNPDYEKFISRQGYQISYKLVKFLTKNYDKDRVIKLLQIKYSFIGSAEKDFCKVLNTRIDKLLDQITAVLKS